MKTHDQPPSHKDIEEAEQEKRMLRDIRFVLIVGSVFLVGIFLILLAFFFA